MAKVAAKAEKDFRNNLKSVKNKFKLDEDEKEVFQSTKIAYCMRYFQKFSGFFHFFIFSFLHFYIFSFFHFFIFSFLHFYIFIFFNFIFFNFIFIFAEIAAANYFLFCFWNTFWNKRFGQPIIFMFWCDQF